MSNERDRSEDTPTEELLSIQQIGRDVRMMKKDLSKVMLALQGDPYDPKAPPGALTLMLSHRDDYYGNKVTGSIGTKEKVDKLWDVRLKILGGMFALGALGSFLGWVVEQYILSKH